MLNEAAVAATRRPPWRVLVVDDDRDVFLSTQLALRNFAVDGRPVDLTYVGSGAAALALLTRDPGFALVLLDVVMESDSAGLDLVRSIRNGLGLAKIRIVLRTGQAGKAPEEQVIRDYEINDYLEKPRADRTRIRTVVATGIRAWAAYDELERSRAAMATLARATRALIGHAPLMQTAAAGLRIILELVDPDGAAFRAGFVLCADPRGHIEVLASSGTFAAGMLAQGVGPIEERLDAADRSRLEDGLREPGVFVGENGVWMSVHRTDGLAVLFYARGRMGDASIEREILETVAGTLGQATENADAGPEAS